MQLALLAALGDAEMDRAAAALGEERLEVGDVVGAARGHEDLARDGRRARVVLLEEAAPAPRRRVASRAASSRKTSRPIILPSRMTNSWTAAWLSCRARPTRSSSVRAKAAIFWLSIVRSIARILSRRTAARSYSVALGGGGHLALRAP